MRIQFLNGGLANQVFQYIFYRFGELRHPGETWFLDDSFFFVHQIHNGYELESVFRRKPNLLSDFFDKDVWDYMISLKREENLSIPEIMRQNGESVRMIAETANWKEWNPFNGMVSTVPANEFHPEIQDIPGETLYYHGYWINHEWFRTNAGVFRDELAFPEISEDTNRAYLDHIQSCNSCSVHIRRGDYASLGLAFRDEDYATLIKSMLTSIPDITLFVFSDDGDYCRSHAGAMGLDLPNETVYVTGNTGKNAFRDMQLMSNCKNMILSNSAFCYLAALLNTRLQNIVNPTSRKI